MDLNVAALFVRPLPWPIAWADEVAPDGPKMEYYYHNLAAIYRQEWWMSPTRSTLDEGNAAGNESSEGEDASKEAMKVHVHIIILPRLCFDLEGATREGINSERFQIGAPSDGVDSIVDSVAIANLFHPTLDELPRLMEASVDSHALCQVLLDTMLRDSPHEFTTSRLQQLENFGKWRAFSDIRNRHKPKQLDAP